MTRTSPETPILVNRASADSKVSTAARVIQRDKLKHVVQRLNSFGTAQRQ